MRRPFFFRGPRGIGRVCRVDSLPKRVESGAQGVDLLLLSVHDIAQLDVRALQERNFRFNPLDFFAGHNDSVLKPTIKTKLVVSRYPSAVRACMQSSAAAV